MNILIEEYLDGREQDLNPDDEERLKDVKVKMDAEKDEYGRIEYYQSCKDQYLSVEYKGKVLNWNEVDFYDLNKGAQWFGLDFGACCSFVPHLNIDNSYENDTFLEKYHETDFTAMHGEDNGVKILFDIEQWNYAHINGRASGLKVSLSDPRSKPMMEFSSQALKAGSDVKITIKPTVTYTTDDAIEKFEPHDRKCYEEGENPLEEVSYDDGFAYDMINCLINQGLINIYWYCRCVPKFASSKSKYRE